MILKLAPMFLKRATACLLPRKSILNAFIVGKRL